MSCNNSIVFALNGQRIQIEEGEVDPSMSLNEFLRTKTQYRGTKLSCGEGGCGACAVVVTELVDKATQKLSHASMNSCLLPVCAVDGRAVTTSDGLGKRNALGRVVEPHPVATRIAGFNGSQCGFCTPGMVMTMYAALKDAEASSKDGNPTITMSQIEKQFDGNICRSPL